MKRFVPWLLAVAAVMVFVFAGSRPAAAQVSQLRGKVLDTEGNPIPDVEVLLEYKGEKQGSRNSFKVKTGKNGGWIRIGIPAGPYTIKFSKEGYKTKGIEYILSFGALSEIEDLVLSKLAAGEKAIEPGELEKAEAEAKKKAEEEAKLGKIYQDAMTAVAAKDWDTAEGLFRQVIAGAPDNPLVHFNLAVVLVKRNDPAKNDLQSAEQEYRKVLELEPSNSEAIVSLAVILEEMKRGPEAVDLLESRTKDFQDDVAFQTALGAMAMNAGRSDEAKAAFTKVLELDPTNAEAHYHLASLAINEGDVKAGIAHLEKVVELSPQDSATVADAKALIEALKSSK